MDEIISGQIEKMRSLLRQEFIGAAVEAAYIGISLLHETVGTGHPVAQRLNGAIEKGEYITLQSGSSAVITMYESGLLMSPRMAIAHEIEGDLLDIGQEQLQAAEANDNEASKQIQLAIAAFLAGAVIEDALRRICDSHEIQYDAGNTSISKLQQLLYRPSESVKIVSRSETKQITAWGDTRNKADHGNFLEITVAETTAMIIGVRAFIDHHLP